MVAFSVAEAFQTWISRRKRGARKAGKTWRILRSSNGETAEAVCESAYVNYRAGRRDNSDTPECLEEFRRDVHNLSNLAEKWVSEPAKEKNLPALKISLKGRSLVIATIDRLPRPKKHSSEKTIAAFYKAIQAREYTAAWNLLSPGMQTRVWPAGLTSFEHGYKTYTGHRYLQIMLVESEEGSAKVDVLYEEDQFPPRVPAMEQLANLTVKNVHSVPRTITRIKTALLELGADAKVLERISISRFFKPDAMIAIPYLVGISAEIMARAFPPRAEPQVFHRARRIRCSLNPQKMWVIDSIQPLIN